MSHNFRKLSLALGLTLAAALAAAQGYPDRAVRLLVTSNTGASGDFIARLVADRLSKSLGQPVVVENRAGAGGVLAVRMLLGAVPDGHTLMMFISDNVVIAPYLLKIPAFDPLKDLSYVGTIARSVSFILAVNPSVPVHSFAEYVSLAKQAPKKVSFSTYGLGSVPQLSFEMMAAQAGIELLHVPYKGGAESYRAAVAGDVDSVAGTSFTDLLKAGRLRPIAIGASKRSPEFPQVPTFAELGYGDQIFGPVFYGMAAPAGTPREIVNRLTAELKALAQMPDIAQRLRTVGTEPFSTGPEELVNMVRTHSDRYAPLIRKLGLNTQ